MPGFPYIMNFRGYVLFGILLMLAFAGAGGQTNKPRFRAIAFFTAKNDQAHISFVHEANRWFNNLAARNNFIYDSTSDWSKLNTADLKKYQLVIFLDTRPEKLMQREAFEAYMKGGGSWIGFHFAGFALTPSDVPQNWNWYHEQFLGSGQYASNTWMRSHPTCLNYSDHLPPSGIAGQMIFEKILLLIFWFLLIQRVFRWAPDRRNTRSGMKVIIRLYGQTKITGWYISIWVITILIMKMARIKNCR